MKNLMMLSLTAVLIGCSTTNHIGEPEFDTAKLYCPSDYVEVCKGRHKDFMTCECVSSMGLRFPEFLF